MSLDERHRWITQKIAEGLQLPNKSIADDYCGKEPHSSTLNSFLNDNNLKRIMFFYQPKEKLSKADGAIIYDGPNTLILTTGDTVGLRGRAVFFIRMNMSKPPTKANIDQEVLYGIVEPDILADLHTTIKEVLLPALKTQDNLGASVAGAEANDLDADGFLDMMDKFSKTVQEAAHCIRDSVQLKKLELSSKIENNPASFARALKRDPALIEKFESIFTTWLDHIEKEMQKSEQIRKESDDLGPNSELEHWKARLSKFNSITDQVKGKDFKVVYGLLNYAKVAAGGMKKWKELDARVTDYLNEAKDNVKYLYTLDRLCTPLYDGTPETCIEAVPALISAIGMMHSIARYYNTNDRMTALFVKITNQMITCCKKYLKQGGRLFDQDRTELIRKINICHQLNATYQENYRETKQQLESQTNGAKRFDFSDMAIFGKFNAFCERLEKLKNVYTSIEQFWSLKKSTIEGMGALLVSLDDIVATFAKKSYDLLDHRCKDFESDYNTFQTSISGLEEDLKKFIDTKFEAARSTEEAFEILSKFNEVLARESLKQVLFTKHHLIFEQYGEELADINTSYEQLKDSPPVARDMPPVSGNISWARHLLRRVEEPMKLFAEHTDLLKKKDAKKMIKKYNKIAAALIGFENLWHQGWVDAVIAIRSGLNATLLVRHPDTGKLFVNFDRSVIQLTKEARQLELMELDVPDAARFVVQQEETLKSHLDKLSYMLREHERVMAKVAPVYEDILKPSLRSLDQMIEPGLTTLTWTSVNIEGYLFGIHRSLDKLEEVLDKANDILECRIDGNFREILRTKLLVFPPGEIYTVKDFIKRTETQCKELGPVLDAKSRTAEKAVIDLSATLTYGYTKEEYEEVREDLESLIALYNRRNYESIFSCVTDGLKVLRDRFTPGKVDCEPFFSVNVELQIPNTVMTPALEDIQKCMNETAKKLLDTTKLIYRWGQDRDLPAARLKTVYNVIARDKKIVKLIVCIAGAFHGLRREVTQYLKQFNRHDYLWQDNKNEAFARFEEECPELSLDGFESQIKKYDDITKSISAIEHHHIIGSLQLNTEPLKIALESESNEWKYMYGGRVNQKAQSDMHTLIEFMNETTHQLDREIRDLEDIRTQMNALGALREVEGEIDLRVAPIEDAYALLNKYDIRVSKEETDAVDRLRYNYSKLKSLAVVQQDTILRVQPGFKSDLVNGVAQLVKDVATFEKDYGEKGPNQPGIKPRVAVDRLRAFQKTYDQLEKKNITYSGGEELFGLPVTSYPELAKIKKELKLLSTLYNLYVDVDQNVNKYGEILWHDLDIEKIASQVGDYQNKCRKMPKALRDFDAYEELKNTIDNFVESLPLVQMMAEKAILPRHWGQMKDITGVEFAYDSESFKLGDVISAPLLKNREELEEVCIAAVKEAEIEIKLNQLKGQWRDQEFTFAPFKARGDLLLKAADLVEIVTNLEDAQMALSSLMSNRYNVPFKNDIHNWLQKLSTASEVIESWQNVQNLWMYLEAVFAGGDIAAQLPQEAKRFSNIDKSWVRIMTTAWDRSNVVSLCYEDDTLRNLLPHLTEQLELCQKSLSGYLENKRNLFPRFYFVSDPQLLEILGQGSDPHTIQPHLQSIFDNMGKVEFDKVKRNKINKMFSGEGECVPMSFPVICEGNIEAWLAKLEDSMKETLRDIIDECSDDYLVIYQEIELKDFLDKYPAQVALLGLQFKWTTDCQHALENAKVEKNIMVQTNKKVNGVLRDLVMLTTLELTKMDRVKIETCITIQVHQRDVFDAIVKARIKSAFDFEWLKQTRFFWRPDLDTCMIQITDVDFEYSYEFLGNTDRLVITPLTDRCYITLAQALGLYLGGAPAGPAGTGKTETTKDMGRCLGKYVVVFNCSDQMDYRGLGKIYKGLAQSGAWGCFDEFNRIDLEVLSVVAQQVQCILTACRDHKSKFIFTDGCECSLDQRCGFFITMNPGYAGRQELPENLKALFRSVSMMVPDRQIIMRVKLAASGFQESTLLGKKFFVLYGLCEQQLSKQRHYDFGLRNILSVLRTLGPSKRANPDAPEPIIFQRVVRDLNLSKLIDEDEPLFLSLINDLFPGQNVDKERYPDLEAAISTKVQEAGLVNYPNWNLKVIQLFETARVRWGIMVLGPSRAGKSRCIQILQEAMTATGTPHQMCKMNPKAITAPQMFGRLDVATNDWTDGIFAALWRRECKRDKHSWIVLDGPVDAIWIENLNTVLDDNRTLTLANGDRIAMAPNLKLIFEVANLDNASPATVSRAGIIFMSASSLSWRPLVDAWVLTRGSEAAAIREHFETYCGPIFKFLVDSCSPKMKIEEVNAVITTLNLLDGMLPPKGEECSLSPIHLHRLFLLCMTWGLGGLLELDDMARFHKQLIEMKAPMPDIAAGSSDLIYEYTVCMDGDRAGEWEHWKHRVTDFAYPADTTPDFATVLVPTVDNTRVAWLLECMAKQRKHVLLIGVGGSAKTVSVLKYMMTQNPDVMLSKNINFSSATTPGIFQRTIEGSVEKRIGTTFGPPGNRKMIVFVDDINMPVVNDWGDQITNEIVRQVIEDGGCYNLEKPGEWTTIADLQFLAAMSHPGGGKNDIPARLKGHFGIFNVTLPSSESMDDIFGTILKGHFVPEREFSQEVIDLAPRISTLTRLVWQATKVKMLPTPAKFHYVFNLRDLSRIVEGVIKAEAEVVNDTELLLQLWKHECDRVLADRFNDEADVDWFNVKMREIIAENFDEEVAENTMKPVYFVDFLRDAPDVEDPDIEPETPHIYEPIPSFDDLRERIFFFQTQYNETVRGSGLDLVLFEDAMKHMMRIVRIIGRKRGSAMLVGVGGSGKQSLTRLASFICEYQTLQIVITKTYNVTNLLEDCKILYKNAALGKPMTFLFTDNEIKEEGFLEYINMILASGEVVGLFAKDEIDGIISDIRPIFKQKRHGEVDSFENLYKFYIDQVRDNLHVVLCFSPVGDKFRSRAQKFPALFSGCTMDWFFSWPEVALRDVARKFLSTFAIECEPETKENLVLHMARVQSIASDACLDYFNRLRKPRYVTPKSYLSFISGYMAAYKRNYDDLNEQASKLLGGLEKLKQAEEDVAAMKIELGVKQKDLAVAQDEIAILLEEIKDGTQKAEKVKASVEIVKNEIEAKAEVIAGETADAEKDLEAAKPALQEAEDALQAITPGDITVVKKLAKPPNLVKRLMDGVLLLRRLPIDRAAADPEFPDKLQLTPSWSKGLQMMGDKDFLNTLLFYPKDDIDDEQCELLMPYLEMEDFTTEKAKSASGNVAGICTWIRAMVTYQKIAKVVAPKKIALAKSQRALAKAQAELAKAQAELDEKQAELDAMQAKYDAAMADKQKLEDDLNNTMRKMNAANALIGGLAGEKVRWTEESAEFKMTMIKLVGDVAIALGFLSYSGPFNQEFRTQLEERWVEDLKEKNIPFNPKVNVVGFLTDESTVAEWNLQGLPTDDLSTENGIIVTAASRYPLLIDPQGQGKQWIKNREEPNGLKITKLEDKYFRQHLEDCLGNGLPLLLEDVEEELDPMLDPVLEKNYVKIGKSLKVRVGDKECDITDGFMIYITTKLPNPNYTPEISAKTSIIDFTVTIKGLEDQLLGRVILKERPELEEERQRVLEDVTSNKKKIKQLADDLLNRLSSATGNLLDDVSLIDVLNNTKKTAAEVTDKIAAAAEIEKQINAGREEYRPVAARGSILYFLVSELSLISHMYQTSLNQFLGKFDEAIDLSEPAKIASKRIANVIEFATFYIFKYIQRGLYENDKQVFKLLLAIKIDLQQGKVTHKEFDVLVKAGGALDINGVRKKPFPWIPDKAWLNLVALGEIGAFFNVLNAIEQNQEQWRKWYDLEQPENGSIPDGYEEKLDQFRRLLLVRCFREDRTMLAATQYIIESIGQKYAEGIPLNLEETLDETTPFIPIIFILSLGSDPTAQIEALAKKKKQVIKGVSMGQGQEVIARRLIQDGIANGGWVLLQNCHLGLKFLAELQVTLPEMEEPHPDFRCWVTAEPHPKFPINLLQMSIKLTNEPPEGVKAGLRRSYAWINQDMIEQIDKPQWRPILWTQCFLHTCVQERRKFGPLGWNVPYEFNQSDLSASVQFLQKYLYGMDDKKGITWSTVRYMVCEVMYGGRITDDFDRVLMNTYGNLWLDNGILQPNFCFNGLKQYPIPAGPGINEFRAFIEQLPLIDTPEAFGLHPNADLSFRAKQATTVLDTILSIQPKEAGGGGGETREDVVLRVVNDLQSKLPPDYVKSKVKDQIKNIGGPVPLNIFLGQEVDRMQAVLGLVRRHLSDLKLAIAGTIIMSETLTEVLDNLYDAKPPPTWVAKSWISSSLGYWFSDLVARCEQYTSWLVNGRPRSYWLTGWFNPQGFLTAMRQEVTRAHNGWALDTVSLCTEVTKLEREEINKPPADGVYIHGLFLEGAAWDKKNCKLIDSAPKVLYVTLPVVLITAVNTPVNDPRAYQCPVYKILRRTDANYVLSVALQTDEPPSKWILRGVCALESIT